MSKTVKIEQNVQYVTQEVNQSDQNQYISGQQSFEESKIQASHLNNKQHQNLSYDSIKGQNQYHYYQFSSNSLNFDTSSLMNLEVSEPPTPPLRFSEVQKSIQVLRRAIPDIIDDNLVDKMYFALLNNKNNIMNRTSEYSRTYNFSEHPPNFLYHKTLKTQQQKVNKKQLKQNKLKIGQKMIQDKTILLKEKESEQNLQTKKNRQKKQSPNIKSEHQKKLSHIWTEQMQNDFVEFYRKNSNIHDIKNYLIKRYPQYQQYFTYPHVRGQGYKILRLAVKKLYYLIANCKEIILPELLKVTQIRSNFIFYFKQGAQVRCLLAELYKLEQFNYDFLHKLITSINNLFLYMEQDKVIMSKIGRNKGKARLQSANKFVSNHLQKNHQDFYFEDDGESESSKMYGYSTKK